MPLKTWKILFEIRKKSVTDPSASSDKVDKTNQFVIGVDVGGTFTDFIAIDRITGSLRVDKLPTTTGDQSKGFLAGVERLNPPGPIVGVVHGTTAGTNAVLERKGAVCGMLTTRGFRDILEIGRRTRPTTYGLTGEFTPLIPRHLRLEVTERINADGDVVEPLDEGEVVAAIKLLLERGAEALCIHFMNSYANSAHERRCKEIAEKVWPNNYISCGSEVLPEIREFERGTAAAINGYIQPNVSEYIGRVADGLEASGVRCGLQIMQANGGLMPSSLSRERAIHTVMSGPAGGAIAVSRICAESGFLNAIGCDMGGTSFDVSLIFNGHPSLSSEKDLEYGLPVRIPMVDIHTIGAGGGSIARIDRAGILKVGPDSAGSFPGPICFGRGGALPTITDANLVLGRLSAEALNGISSSVDIETVNEALEQQIGKPLGLGAVEAAEAVLTVATSHMAAAVRLVSVARGYDPRDFVICAIGGAGPLHAVSIARELGIPTVVVPRFPGITSALGCAIADARYDFGQTFEGSLGEIDADQVEAILVSQAARGHKILESDNSIFERVDVFHEADLLYRGQTHLMRVPLTSSSFNREEVEAAFAEKYRDRFDISLPEMQPWLVNLRTTVLGRRPPVRLNLSDDSPADLERARIGVRSVRFDDVWTDTPVYRRERLPKNLTFNGPAIVEQLDTTTVIDPRAHAIVHETGNLIITVLQ